MEEEAAVKKLITAGAEDAKATNKLKEAVCTVTMVIINQCPVQVFLPRGYVVKPSFSEGLSLFKNNVLIGGKGHKYTRSVGKEMVTDLYTISKGQTREACLDFAKDVAEGLLGEISEFLESRAAQANEKTAELAKVAEAETFSH